MSGKYFFAGKGQEGEGREEDLEDEDCEDDGFEDKDREDSGFEDTDLVGGECDCKMPEDGVPRDLGPEDIERKGNVREDSRGGDNECEDTWTDGRMCKGGGFEDFDADDRA